MFNIVGHMSKEPRVGARIPSKLRTRLDRALIATNQKETDFIVCALEEFLDRHPSKEQKIEAIVRGHVARKG